jgi:hypothetical protein
MAFPGTYNFNYYRGDTFNFALTPKDSTGVTFPLTGYTAIFKIANARGAGATQYSGDTSIDTLTNKITCTIPSSLRNSLTGGNTYVYDVQISTGAVIYTLLTGTISVTDDIAGAV